MIKMKHDNLCAKHDALVNIVAKELKARNFDVHKFIKFKLYRQDGEMDLYAIKDNYMIIAEIKCSHNYKTEQKAMYQLHKDEQLFDKYRIFKFMVYYKDHGAHYQWIKT